MKSSGRQTLLLVEDNPGDVRLLREMLNEQNSPNIELIHAECMSDAEELLATHVVDIVLLDLGLPDVNGLEGIQRTLAAAPSVPVVALTGLDDESIGARALQAGALEYLVKGRVDALGLLRALRYAIEVKGAENAARAMALRMVHSEEHDVLTGVPDRTLLNDRLNQVIAEDPHHGKKIGVLCLDLDGFKNTNNSLGHAIGDRLLQSVAKRLVDTARVGDTVGRQGGDEFVIVLSALEQAEEAADMARRMLQAVARPHCIDGQELHLTASIGVSVYPEDGLNAETLVKNANIAMHHGKESGRHSYQFFKSAMNVCAVERQSIEEGLRRALERHEFVLHYQPKINLATGAITGAEALIRWTHPTRGSVSPAQFIYVAEDAGLIIPIGAWVIREACAQAQTWLDAGLPPITMAVNVSAIEFRDEKFLEGVLSVLAETKLAPGALELELTESVLMKHAAATTEILQELRKCGVRVAIDDFGTGYSSLSYLRNFSVDCLKIDQSFIRQIDSGGDGSELVAAMIGMAHNLKLRVVAEGVETREEVAFLRARHCDDAQGYYFSRPVAAEQFATLLKTGISASVFTPPTALGAEPERVAGPVAESAAKVLPFSKSSDSGSKTAQEEPLDERRVFLYRQQVGRREIRLALGAVIISAGGFLATLPFVTVPLVKIPAFIPAYQSALVICDFVTAVLLFSQFNTLRSRALLALACGYLFTAFIALTHALSFPGVFSPTGLLGAGPQSTAWLYMFWHAGFPLFAIAYTLLKDELLDAGGIYVASGSPSMRAGHAILGSIAGVFTLVCGLTLVATVGHDFLPRLILADRFTPTMTVIVTCIWAFSLAALAMLWWRRPRTVLDLWLMVVMCAWLFDIALSAVLNAARYDVGWYGGRIYGLLAASFLLVVLQIENGTYYARLAKLSAEMGRLSRHDSLTDLANRRLLDDYLARQAAIARRQQRPLALLMCDVDAFKAYNDHYGHQAGDECLRQIADALKSCCRRPADLVARYGGEEFAVILPDTDIAGATLIAEAIRRTVAQLKIPHAKSPVGNYVTISGGVAVLLCNTDLTNQQLIMAADEGLYQAKRLGRNRMTSLQVKVA